uniref:Transmembrane inner ear expressed protein n=2 Tax=Lutzomyia longipalpis TaxID=7200 RepID=A0A7G3B2X2_LUTLO
MGCARATPSSSNCRILIHKTCSVAGAMSDEPEWLEDEALGGFRVWHLIFLSASGALSLIIVLCCCFRFRIPRTKQDIEADYQRRKIARKFRERLACIHNSEMDAMDLQKGS